MRLFQGSKVLSHLLDVDLLLLYSSTTASPARFAEHKWHVLQGVLVCQVHAEPRLRGKAERGRLKKQVRTELKMKGCREGVRGVRCSAHTWRATQ